MKIIKLLCLICIGLILSGCLQTSPASPSTTQRNTIQIIKEETVDSAKTISVYHDDTLSVTCWNIHDHRINAIGFSCISDTQLKTFIK